MTSGPIATYGLEQIALRTVPRLEHEGAGAVASFVARLRGLSVAVSLLLGLGWDDLRGRDGALAGRIPALAPATTLRPGKHRPHPHQRRSTQGAFPSRPRQCLRPCPSRRHFLPLRRGLRAPLQCDNHPRLLHGQLPRRRGPRPLRPWRKHRGRFVVFPDRKLLASLLREGFPICCVSLFGALAFIVPLAICEFLRPGSEVSHLTAAFRISILFIVLSGAIHGVFAPALSRSAAAPSPLRPVLGSMANRSASPCSSLVRPSRLESSFPGR